MYDQQGQTSQWPPRNQFKQSSNFQPLWNQQTKPEIPSIRNPHFLEYRHDQSYFPPQETGLSPVIGMKRPKLALHRYTTNKFIWSTGSLLILILVILVGVLKANVASQHNQVSVKPTLPPIGTDIQNFDSPNGATSSGFLAWSQDGTQLFSVRQNGTVQEWNTATWNTILTYEIPRNFIYAASWSPDRLYFATSDLFDQQSVVKVWNALTGDEVLAYQGHSDLVTAIAWSPNGTRIATGSSDKTVQIWDAATGNTIRTYLANSAIWAVAWSPDGTRITFASDAAVQIFDVLTGNTLLTYHGHPDGAFRLAWSPDGKYLASAGSKSSTVQIWNSSNGNRLPTYQGHSQIIMSIAWSPDGRRIATGSDDKTVQIWDATTGNHIFTYPGHSGVVASVIWSPNGRFISSSAEDGTLKVWWAI